MSNNFTVVTPNYNMGGYLADTIESVLRNLKPGDEYYVIDGGSSDDSLEVIKRYADRLTGWISEKDKGYADALAKGFAKSTATYQCWINSGDLLLDGALDKARECLKTSGADMIFGDDFYIDDADAVLGFSSGACKDLRKAMLYGDWTPLQDACFWSSELYRRVGGLDATLRNAADYDLFARFSVNGNTRYESFAFSAFRRHAEQRSIAHRTAYKDEKKTSQKRLTTSSNDGFLSKLFLRVSYFISIRWRVRVLQRRWDQPHLHGKNIKTLPAGSYGLQYPSNSASLSQEKESI